MASTEKVSLTVDADTLLLARRAAALHGLSLSAYVSGLLRRHVWESEPAPSPEEHAHAASAAEHDLREHLLTEDAGGRAAG